MKKKKRNDQEVDDFLDADGVPGEHAPSTTSEEDEDDLSRSAEKRERVKRMRARAFRKAWIIYPEDDWKGKWDLYITVILIFTCLSTPYLISFDAETDAWQILNYSIDLCFLADIVLTFAQAFYDDDFNIVDSRKEIARQYLKGWFTIDLVAIVPMDKVSDLFASGDSGDGSGGANKMIRLTRIGRMSKLIKLTRLLRVLKIIKEKSKVLTYL